ncbi:hypothetical protein IFM89_025631 [Coptis chinensis]|uniref:BHLH domain-containing protein n=1 Tax=Coptis chinensis TaxID=261450 RepID=A0A835LNK7_9MAGN|nr:hypothetical protein IFM89_025631 [Coptis chinensis]
MAEFAVDMHAFKPSLSYTEMDSNIELINHFGELNSSFLENPSLSIQNTIGFSNDNFLAQQQPDFPVNFANVPGIYYLNDSIVGTVDHTLHSAEDAHQESKKRKATPLSNSSSGNSTTPTIQNGLDGNVKSTRRKNNSGRGRRGRNPEKDVEKPKEVIHVRARRGQATDSHSLAERVRREKINEKLRSLQELVPGCYKTMGMAVMLDEIISYVQSLQNQVEFLSMKLTAASSFYDFNSDMDVTQIMQGTNAYEAQEVEKLVREGGYGGLSCFQQTWPL